MKKTYNAFFMLFCILLLSPQILHAQDTLCPPPATTTFSTTLDRVGDYFEWVSKSIQNQDGDIVVVGYKEVAPGTDDFELYFARCNELGQLVGDQIIIPLDGFYLYYDQPTEVLAETQLIEVTLPGGAADGYLVAVSVREATTQTVSDAALVRLDKTGCPLWVQRIPTDSPYDIPVGLFQDDTGGFVLFTAKEISPIGLPGMDITIVDPSGSFCSTLEYSAFGDYLYPVAVKRVNGGLAQNARYVVLANYQGAQFTSPEQIAVGFITDTYDLLGGVWSVYDFDFNTGLNSNEIAVDIEQYNDDLIIAGHLSRNGIGESFLMSITPFDPTNTFTGLFNYAVGYIDPNGNNFTTDLVVDVLNDRFTLSYVNFDFMFGLPVVRTLQTDPIGLLLWNRGYATTDEPFGFTYTLMPTNDGGYFEAGVIRGGPAAESYPMWIAKMDDIGQLSNCDCYEDFTITSEFIDAEVSFWDGGFLELPCDLINMDYQCEVIDQELIYCDPETPPPGPCEDLDVFVTAIDTSNHQCCWALSYNNGGQDNPYYITITSLDSAQLVYDPDTDIPPPLRRFSFNDTMVVIGMEMPGGPLPTGNFDDFFTFCLSNIQNSPQQVLIEWRDSAYNVICDETLEFDCEPELEECLYILTDTLICDSAGYKYIATVKNPINSEFPVGLIKLNVLNPSTGIMVQDSIIELDPALAIGDTMMIMFVIETEENLFGEDFCFLLSAHDSPDELLCCAEIEKCIPFPQCDPCEEVDVMAMPIDPINEDSCCYTFTVKNGYDVPGYFTNIEMNILTEGVYFSVTEVPTPPVWWYEEIETGTHYLMEPFQRIYTHRHGRCI